VPAEVDFATKTQIALAQLETLLAEGAPKHCVLADAAYGVDQAFRQRLADLGLPYVVGITSSVVVWPPGVEPLAPKRYSGTGRPPSMPRRNRSRQPLSVKDLAQGLAASAFQTISWREGTNATLTGRFAAVRVRHAGGNIGKARLHPQQWLLIEWPGSEAAPMGYWLSNLTAQTSLRKLVAVTKQRWLIERDYEELKQEVGLSQYEGRNWRGFHHHATLCIAAYGFLVAERSRFSPSAQAGHLGLRAPRLPAGFRGRGSPRSPATA